MGDLNCQKVEKLKRCRTVMECYLQSCKWRQPQVLISCQLVSSSDWWILYSNCYLTPPPIMFALKIRRILMKLNETWHLPSIHCCQTSSIFITMLTSSLFKPQFDLVANSTYLSTTVAQIWIPDRRRLRECDSMAIHRTFFYISFISVQYCKTVCYIQNCYLISSVFFSVLRSQQKLVESWKCTRFNWVEKIIGLF